MKRDRSTTALPREVEVVVEVMAVAIMEELEVATGRTTATAVLRASIAPATSANVKLASGSREVDLEDLVEELEA